MDIFCFLLVLQVLHQFNSYVKAQIISTVLSQCRTAASPWRSSPSTSRARSPPPPPPYPPPPWPPSTPWPRSARWRVAATATPPLLPRPSATRRPGAASPPTPSLSSPPTSTTARTVRELKPCRSSIVIPQCLVTIYQ